MLLLCCACLRNVSAQKGSHIEALKFDEFGTLGHCDLTARLDNLAIMVQNGPGSKAHIIAYAPPGAGERYLENIKDYLINTRGMAPEQITTTYGGRNTDLIKPKIELWVVPRNAVAPEPQKLENDAATFKGVLIGGHASDNIGIAMDEVMGTGIGLPIHASFADVLNQQKDATGYVVVYSGEDAVPGAWRRIALEQIDYLKPFNVDASRVKMIFGGHQKETSRQLWIVPKDAPPPVRDAGPEQPLAKTVMVGDFSPIVFSDKQNEANIFRRLKDVLDAHKSLRAFVVVRIGVPIPDEPVDEPQAATLEEPSSEPVEQREPVDLTKLIEKWRVEFANTHKIGADRFIVLFTTAGKDDWDNLTIWVVPKGQPLPNPNEDEESEPT